MSQFKFCPLCGGRLGKKKPPVDEKTRDVCRQCGFIFYQNPAPTVLAVIEKGDKILLTKRAINPYKGYWDLPGGFVEIGQNLEKALVKEIKEELGAEVKSFAFLGSFSSQYRIKKKREKLVGVAFRVKLKRTDFKIGSDISEAKWFSKNALPKITPHADVQKALQKILRH